MMEGLGLVTPFIALFLFFSQALISASGPVIYNKTGPNTAPVGFIRQLDFFFFLNFRGIRASNSQLCFWQPPNRCSSVWK